MDSGTVRDGIKPTALVQVGERTEVSAVWLPNAFFGTDVVDQRIEVLHAISAARAAQRHPSPQGENAGTQGCA